LTVQADDQAHTPVLLEVNGVTLQYKTPRHLVTATYQVDFSVHQGDHYVILGPSGCGKSTLLKILAGLLPAAGTAILNGTPIVGPRRDIGMVFQSPVLFPWRTVIDNALLPVDVQRLGRDRMVAHAKTLIALVGLSGFEQRYPWELSGGMQQRVAIVCALIHDPALLLMDEPFGALDALTRESMNVELQRIWLDRRKTVVFVTHSTSEAVFLADRVVVMTPRPGRIGDMLTIDLPRPRTLDVMTTEAFGTYVRRIRAGLNAGGGIE
jgi:NitT/TauT family transport system ATP-binding protein